MTGLLRSTKRQAIKDRINQMIREQKLSPGDPIQSQNQLAKHFNVTPVTVHKALTELATEGVVYRVQGSGTFVGKNPESSVLRSVCLVLPGEHLDQPEYNPEYWPYVQQLFRAFMEAVGDKWAFSTRAALPDADTEPICQDLERQDLVVLHYSQQPRSLIEALVERGNVPTACMGLPRDWLDTLTIDHDMVAGTVKAIQYLTELGYKNIAMVRCEAPWAELWHEGYRRGLAEVGQVYDDDLVFRVGVTRSEAETAVPEILKQKGALDALFVDSDLRALGIIDGLQAAGVDVPNDLGVMGYEGLDVATRHPPYLTSLEIPYRRMVEAALAACDKIQGPAFKKEHLALVGDIFPGQTCKKAGV